MQDHSFSKSHIEKVRKLVEETDENPSNAGSYTPEFVEKTSLEMTNLLKQRTSNVAADSTNNEAGSSRPSMKSMKSSTVLLPQQTTTTPGQNNSKKSSTVPAAAVVESSLNAASLAQNLLPYMYAAGNPAAYYASMMMPSGFGGKNCL